MKRTILQIVAVFGVFSATVACQAEDSLFSHTPINSVFAQPGVGGANGPAGGQMPEKRPPMRITGAPELAALVSQAGLDPKAVSENVVSTKIHHQSWSFPALVTTTDDRSQVVLVLLLSVVKDDQQLPAAKLLELMNANRDHAPAFFAFSAKRKRVELHRTLDNSGVTSEQLREEINRLAEIAASTQSLWKVAETPTAKTDSAPKAAPQPTTSAGGSAAQRPAPAQSAGGDLTLVGRWSAARSKTEAFAMQLKADGSFVLVHVNQGKQTRSTGKFTLKSGQLTLAGDDGSKLAGSLAMKSQQEFTFQPAGGKAGALTFKKAS